MHRTPVDVVPRHDLALDGHLLRARRVYTVGYEEFDRETGEIRLRVPPPGGNTCTERVVLPKERYHEFWIRWDWSPSTSFGWGVVKLGAIAILAPLWIGADLLISSDLPVLKSLGHRIHPKRSR